MELGGVNGIDVKKELEQRDTVWKIVFVTGYYQYVYDAFGIITLGFVKKPIKGEEVIKWLEVGIRQYQKNSVYELESQNGKQLVQLREIFCLEASGNYTYLHKRKERVLLNYKLKVCHEMLDVPPIIRIHKSYVINLQQVTDWDGDKVTLANREEIPIGRKYREVAFEKYKNYKLNKFADTH